MKASFQTLVSALFLAATIVSATPIPFDPPTGDDCLKNPTKAFCGANTGAFPRQVEALPNQDDCLKNPTKAFCGKFARELPTQEECLANPTKAFCGAFAKRQSPSACVTYGNAC